MPKAKFIAALLLAVIASGSAQEHEHGTSEKFGTVNFPTSCTDAAQRDFNWAVALLHSFQFSRAIEGFNLALAADPTCGVAYCGL